MTYDVVGLLGRGGSAVVELALDGDGRRVATKRLVLTGSAAQMDVARQRLRREAEILRGLAHRGIVPVLDVIDDGSEVILVFPALVESLQDRVDRLGPLPPSEVARIGRVLIEALAAAHRHGVVHRDIKPANVMFDHAGAPALTDFGVAVTRDSTAGLTLAGTVVGSPMWMAPEQARGELIGPASDVFSLAATLNFAATGEGPYVPGSQAAVMARAARYEIRTVRATVPDPLRAALVAMLDPRAERRPSAAGVLGGLDGTRTFPVRRARRVSLGALAPRRLASWSARALGDPVPRPVGAAPRRRLALTASLVSVAVVLGLVAVAVTHGLGASSSRVPACTARPYLPCGTTVPFPHTNGTVCDPGWYDLNGLSADGCEARSDYVAGAVLTDHSALHANVVPVSASDVFATHVSGDALNLCWGALHVTLTAPAGTAEQVTLWRGTSKVAAALSANGIPATATLHKPSCFSADSEDLRVTVSVVAANGAASAADFILTRDGGW